MPQDALGIMGKELPYGGQGACHMDFDVFWKPAGVGQSLRLHPFSRVSRCTSAAVRLSWIQPGGSGPVIHGTVPADRPVGKLCRNQACN